jgi:hypothetical protein
MKKFQKERVLVGIPESDNSRDDVTPIGNAAILAINHFGSPANNIPPRPVLDIGIRNARPEITACFKDAAIKALSGGTAEVTRAYNRAGSIAANSVKKAINAQEGFPGPSAATLAARKSKGFKGTKSLIVTGAMRNAITYVVEE